MAKLEVKECFELNTVGVKDPYWRAIELNRARYAVLSRKVGASPFKLWGKRFPTFMHSGNWATNTKVCSLCAGRLPK